MKKLITYFQRLKNWIKNNLNSHHADEVALQESYMKAMNESLEVAKRQ